MKSNNSSKVTYKVIMPSQLKKDDILIRNGCSCSGKVIEKHIEESTLFLEEGWPKKGENFIVIISKLKDCGEGHILGTGKNFKNQYIRVKISAYCKILIG